MDVEMRILRQQVEDLGGAAHTNELHGAAGGRAAIETAVAAGLLECRDSGTQHSFSWDEGALHW